VVWAILVVCVAALAAIVLRSRKPEEEPAPIVAVPTPTPKPTPKGTTPVLRAKPSIPPPVAEPPVEKKPASIPLEDPVLELGKAGVRPKVDSSPPKTESKPPSSYLAPEVEFDPQTPDIPLAEEPRSKAPSVVPPVMARTKSATIPPVVRTKAPSIPPPERAKAVSVQPPVAADEVAIPVAPESGLQIRAKRPSSAPPVAMNDTPKKGTPAKGVVVRKPPTLPPDANRRATPAPGLSVRSKTPGAVQQIAPLEIPPAVIPDGLAKKLRYTTLNANISHVGISASREDGFSRVVMWPDVVGIVARRLPADDPYKGATFIDLVSSAGATLRILPWTVLTGDAVTGEGAERARSFCQLVAARCRGAKLDSATRTFIGSHGQAAQLPDEDTLDAHDKRLA
jgi:hypothetical protein